MILDRRPHSHAAEMPTKYQDDAQMNVEMTDFKIMRIKVFILITPTPYGCSERELYWKEHILCINLQNFS